MFDEEPGIMEYHGLEPAFLKKDDLNFPAEILSRDTKRTISMKPNSLNPEKLTRAKAAVELYKVDKILTPAECDLTTR